jgi:hypothetical protein
MRTLREIATEAHVRASQAMTAAGWGVYPVGIIGNTVEEQYWEEWNEAYVEALEDLEAENETNRS